MDAAALARLLLAAAALLAALRAATARHYNNLVGPYRVIPERVTDCPAEMAPQRRYYRYRLLQVRNRKKPDTWFFSGNVTTYITLNDNYTVKSSLASWMSRGGWAENAYNFHLERPCTMLQTYMRPYWRTAMEILFHDQTRTCPFPPGFYSFTNFSTDCDIRLTPVFFYGKYRTTVNVLNSATQELVACLRGFFSLVPKLDRR